jgi:hypothetical protein
MLGHDQRHLPHPPKSNKVPSTAYTYVSPIGVDLDEQLGIAEIPEPPESALMQELNDDDGPRSS